MSCAECGASLPDRARFCSACGAPVDDGAAGDGGSADGDGGAGSGAGGGADGDDGAEATTVIEPGRSGEDGSPFAGDGGSSGPPGPSGGGSGDRTTVIGDTDPDLEPVGVDGDGELVTCPSCGASNSARRLLCGSCGSDLETGRPGRPLQRGTGGPGGPADEDSGGRTVPTALLVVAGAVLVGVAVGFALLGAGVIGDGGGAEDPLPDPPAFTSPAEHVGVRRVVASSAVGDGAGPGVVADRDITTAWRAAEGRTEDQALRLELGQATWVEELLFAVGDQAGDPGFSSHARPTRVRVAFSEDDTVVVQLADQPGVQRVSLDPARRTDVVRIEILEVAGGGAGSVAMSEIVVRGHPAA